MSATAELSLQVDDHPLLRVAALVTDYPASLSKLDVPEEIAALLALDASAPLERDENLRTAIRDVLRHGGFKPTGRGKPASEYLVATAVAQRLTSINLAVDAGNAVSLHSGFPVSVVDLARTFPPFRIGLASDGMGYVFNAAGQEIDLGGLVCLFDQLGPCANAVRDAQRTKTRGETIRTLTILWGSAAHVERLHAAEVWYRSLLESVGARTTPIA